MLWNPDSPEAGLLENLPLLVAVGVPIREGDKLVDLELVWLNDALRSRPHAARLIGARASGVFSDLVAEGWLDDLAARESKGESLSVYRTPVVEGSSPAEVYRLESSWSGGRLIMSIFVLGHSLPTTDDAIRAASTITQLMPRTSILFAIRADKRWVSFTSQAFRDRIGHTAVRLSPYDLLGRIAQTDVPLVENWPSVPVVDRPIPLLCRVVNDAGQELWVELWVTRLVSSDPSSEDAALDGDFIVVRDVDPLIHLAADGHMP